MELKRWMMGPARSWFVRREGGRQPLQHTQCFKAGKTIFLNSDLESEQMQVSSMRWTTVWKSVQLGPSVRQEERLGRGGKWEVWWPGSNLIRTFIF